MRRFLLPPSADTTSKRWGWGSGSGVGPLSGECRNDIDEPPKLTVMILRYYLLRYSEFIGIQKARDRFVLFALFLFLCVVLSLTFLSPLSLVNPLSFYSLFVAIGFELKFDPWACRCRFRRCRSFGFPDVYLSSSQPFSFSVFFQWWPGHRQSV